MWVEKKQLIFFKIKKRVTVDTNGKMHAKRAQFPQITQKEPD
jgi:hypothetical protein